MKKIYLTGALALLSVGALAAQSKYDAATRMLLQAHNEDIETVEQTARRISVKAPAADRTMAFIIEKAETCTAADLEAAGAEVLSSSASFAVVNVTLEALEEVAKLDGVKRIAANYVNETLCNYARQASNVDAVHSGQGLPQGYTGKGVIAGVVDTGIQPGHINFTDPFYQESRVMRMWHFYSNDGRCNEYEGDDVFAFSSDNAQETHGTHVAGIMAGNYAGQGKYAFLNDRNTTEVRSQAMPFKGMAPEADLLLSGGALYDANIIGGVHKIMEYAEENGQPFVINLSLGHNHGPHDGTDIATAALDEAGRKGIVCVAAGNEGDTPLAVTKELTDEDNQVMTFLTDNTGSGILDIWVSDDKPVKASWVIFDSNNFNVVTTFTADNSKPGETSYMGNSSSSYYKDTNFNNNYTGYVSLQPSLDERNNRWHIYCTVNVKQKANVGSRYWIGVQIEGAAGQRVDLYGGESLTFTNHGFQEYENGGYDGTINGMACGQNMIVVGSYCTRSDLPNLSGGKRNLGGTVGDISKFSSWGKLHDGRELPTVCAPGEWLASSINMSYAKSGRLEEVFSVGESGGLTDATDYWGYLQGTSMASPAAAGIIALWLQAAPDLTTEQVKDIIAKTSVRDSYVEKNPSAWGAGKIDALAGIKEAIKMQSSLGSIAADSSDALLVSLTEDAVELFVANAASVNAIMSDVQGRVVASAAAEGDTVLLPLAGVDKGVYVVSVDTPAGRMSRKIVVR